MRNKNINSVLLTSGGLDSTTLAYWLYDRKVTFVPLFVDYGQHCAKIEYEKLKTVLPPDLFPNIQKVNISDIYKGTKSRLIDEPNLWIDNVEAKDLYLPYRNLFLLTAGAAFAQSRGYSRLYAAFINSNHAKEIDCSTIFLNSSKTFLSIMEQ